MSLFGFSLVRVLPHSDWIRKDIPCLFFPAFWLNTERFGVSLRIQSECGKIRTRKTPNTGTFHAMFVLKMFTKFHENIPDRVPYFSEVAALQVTALLKEGFVISIFQRFYKILRTVFLKNIFEWLLLSFHGAT